MSLKTLSLTVAFIGSAIAVSVAWRASTAADSAHVARAAVAALQTRTEAELARMNAAVAAAERARVDAEAELAALQTSKRATIAKTPVSPVKHPAASQAAIHPADALAKDPRLQVMQLAAERARFETSFGPLLKKLQLSPEKIAKLREAHVRSEEQKGDTAAIAREQKLKPDDPVLVNMNREAGDEFRAVQMDVLGADGYAAWEGYVQTMPARAIVERFAGAMAIADKPMTADQADRLTEIVALASGPTTHGRLDPSSTDWSVVDQRAASVLSPQQLSLFKRIEPVGGGQSRWMAQFNRAMQEARKSLATASPGP